jgi:uncharacterized protein (TIRG00374 family)
MRLQEEELSSADETLDEQSPASTPSVDGGEPSTEEQELPFFSRRRMIQTAVVVALLVIGIYFLLPKIAGLEDALAKINDADLAWIAVALGFNLAAFATYIALFRAVVGGDVLPLRWTEAYQINMASLAATRLFSAGGAGGIVLTYWALRKAGMPRRESARRMIAFLALQYAFYPLALIIFGILLRTGMLNGGGGLEVTIIPAALAGVVLVGGLMITLIPHDLELRIARFAQGHRRAFQARRLASGPATLAEGVRTALGLFTDFRRGGLAVIGAAGFWAANIGILWASFKAYGEAIPLGVVVQGFFIGMAANLIPFAPAGVGAVDAGMIGAFALFDIPGASVFAAVLTYRMIAFWLPLLPGTVAFLQLRGTVQRWEVEGRPAHRAARAASAPVPGWAP